MSESMAEAEGELFQAKKVKGCWENPWEPWQRPGVWAFMRWLLKEKDNKNIPLDNEQELSKTLPVQTPEFDRLLNKNPDGVLVMWIGHASLLVQFDGISILTDPIFSDRCSPVSEYLPIGPKRYRPPPCGVSDLPDIDIVVISHNHYDHLDLPSVRHLNERFGSSLTWYVPMDMRSWFLAVGCQNVKELVWWQEDMACINRNDFKFVCTPCQHWCRRGVNDYNKALWCSWVIKGPRNSFFFAGDTGYQSQIFKQIGQKYGPFSIAAIPIGNYEPRWFLKYQHANPEEAVQIHLDVRAKKSVGIHWGTFKMISTEFYLEPRSRLQQAVKDRNLPSECFFTMQHGEVKHLEEKDPSSNTQNDQDFKKIDS